MKKIVAVLSLLVVAGMKVTNSKKKSLLFILTDLVTVSEAANSTNSSERIEKESKEARIEIQNLHHLLNGYNSILYRFDEESFKGRKFNNWNYDFTSSMGRPDRQRSKYSTSEAIDQLHNVDEIFPIYKNYYNVTTPAEKNASSFREILNKRVENIEETLRRLEEKYPSSGCDNLKPLMILLCFISIYNLRSILK